MCSDANYRTNIVVCVNVQRLKDPDRQIVVALVLIAFWNEIAIDSRIGAVRFALQSSSYAE